MAEVKYSGCVSVNHYSKRGINFISFVGTKAGDREAKVFELELDSIKDCSGFNGVQASEIPRDLYIECYPGREPEGRLPSR